MGLRCLEGNYEEAIISFITAIEIDPKRPETYSSLSDVYIVQREYDKALEILQQGYESTSSDDLLAKLGVLEDNTPKLEERLDLSDIRYSYEDGCEWDSEAVGVMQLHAVVNGPENVCDVRICSWQKAPYLEQQIIDESSARISTWKEEENFAQGEVLPFSFEQGHPVYPSQRGTTMHVLLIGLNENGNAVAFGIIGEEIP